MLQRISFGGLRDGENVFICWNLIRSSNYFSKWLNEVFAKISKEKRRQNAPRVHLLSVPLLLPINESFHLFLINLRRKKAIKRSIASIEIYCEFFAVRGSEVISVWIKRQENSIELGEWYRWINWQKLNQRYKYHQVKRCLHITQINSL